MRHLIISEKTNFVTVLTFKLALLTSNRIAQPQVGLQVIGIALSSRTQKTVIKAKYVVTAMAGCFYDNLQTI